MPAGQLQRLVMAVYCERSFGGVGRVVSGHLLTVLVSLLVIYVQPAQTQFVIPTTTPRATGKEETPSNVIEMLGLYTFFYSNV